MYHMGLACASCAHLNYDHVHLCLAVPWLWLWPLLITSFALHAFLESAFLAVILLMSSGGFGSYLYIFPHPHPFSLFPHCLISSTWKVNKGTKHSATLNRNWLLAQALRSSLSDLTSAPTLCSLGFLHHVVNPWLILWMPLAFPLAKLPCRPAYR